MSQREERGGATSHFKERITLPSFTNDMRLWTGDTELSIISPIPCILKIWHVENRGLRHIPLETDYKNLVSNLLENHAPIDINAVIKNIQELSKTVDSIDFLFVKHSRNNVAHNLSQKTLGSPSFARNPINRLYFIKDLNPLQRIDIYLLKKNSHNLIWYTRK